MIDETHDPTLCSWVESANDPRGDFPVQNLPFGAFAGGAQDPARLGVAIGERILDLGAVGRCGAFQGPAWERLSGGFLDGFLALGPSVWHEVRLQISRALRHGSPACAALTPCLVTASEVGMRLPAHIGDYTDFFTSIHHARRVGALLRPECPLLPNYRWLPIAYHGRASSIVVSGTGIVRPNGQRAARGALEPSFGASERLDYELELAAWVGPGNRLGQPIAMRDAEQHVFGLCLLNDWSARDVQTWEYQPLGPFLGKSFATSVSPWIVTLEALEPFRCAWRRPPEDPAPLAYLDDALLRERGAIDIELEVRLCSAAMAARGENPVPVSRSNFRDAYWSLAQMVAHHTVGGCNLRPGDLLATGTQSGPRVEESGCLLELTEGGRKPIALGAGEERRFLQDGDEVFFRAHCERPGAARIGFGECRGQVLAAGSAGATS